VRGGRGCPLCRCVLWIRDFDTCVGWAIAVRVTRVNLEMDVWWVPPVWHLALH